MRMFKKIALLIILPVGLSLLALESWGSSLTTGKPAPPFQVESGDSQKLSLDNVHGKVIVLFYESRHVIKKNSALKDELTKLYQTLPEGIKKDVLRLVVIDCSEAILPTLPIWRRQLKMHSIKEGFTIYGDWHRTMFKDYCMQDEDSNFLIIDQHGIIRYSATGKIDPSQFNRIKELLLGLLKES